ncbi:hypothetical protein, partial [Maioricimonas sp. JC845]|uniref:hypothetical protein n=1 Tax=Maioricimonas sp. JC845 TaxID=3232138 RepID=UPI003457E7DF
MSPTTSSGVTLHAPDYTVRGGSCQSFPIDPLAVGLTDYWDWKEGKDAGTVHETWRSLEVTD